MEDDMTDRQFAEQIAEVVRKHSAEADELATQIGELCAGRPNLAVLLALTSIRRSLELQASEPTYISWFFDAIYSYIAGPTHTQPPHHEAH